MRRAVEVNGRTYTISATAVLQGRRGTVATCNELPDLMEFGDTPDDAPRRRRGRAYSQRSPVLACQVTGRAPANASQPDAGALPYKQIVEHGEP